MLLIIFFRLLIIFFRLLIIFTKIGIVFLTLNLVKKQRDFGVQITLFLFQIKVELTDESIAHVVGILIVFSIVKFFGFFAHLFLLGGGEAKRF